VGVGMNAMYVLGAVLSLGLLVYLMIALLKAEWF
jgi:K+-transporting ATPase KdpF subunit